MEKILKFLLEHIDVIISAALELLGGMQIEKIVYKKNGWIINEEIY